MVLEGRSDMGEATVLDQAMQYFVGRLGLDVVSQTTNAISFSGDGGTVNVTVSEEGPDSNVQVIAEGLEEHANRFLDTVVSHADGA